MVGVCMRQQNRIDTRKLGYFYPGGSHPRQEIAELVIEVWIGENTDIREVEQKRRVTDVGDSQPILRCQFAHHGEKVIRPVE